MIGFWNYPIHISAANANLIIKLPTGMKIHPPNTRRFNFLCVNHGRSGSGT